MIAGTMGRKQNTRKTSLGKRLAKIRKDRGLEIEDAAKKVGVTRGAWNHWETGKRLPSPSHLILIDLLENGQIP